MTCPKKSRPEELPVCWSQNGFLPLSGAVGINDDDVASCLFARFNALHGGGHINNAEIVVHFVIVAIDDPLSMSIQ